MATRGYCKMISVPFFSILVGLNCVNPPPCLFKMVDRQFPKFEEGNGWGQFKLVQYAGDPKKVVVK